MEVMNNDDLNIFLIAQAAAFNTVIASIITSMPKDNKELAIELIKQARDHMVIVMKEVYGDKFSKYFEESMTGTVNIVDEFNV